MNKPRRVVWSKAFIIAGLVILIYTLAGFFLAPHLIRHYLPKIIQKHFQKEAGIGKVALNPYLFKLEIQAFRLIEPDGSPIFTFERLTVDFELKSLFKHAWFFREIRFESPTVHAVIQKDGGLNLAHLGPPSDAKHPEDQEQLPRLICENIRIVTGQLTFMDRQPNKPTITLAPLDAVFTNLTTLPAKQGEMTVTATSKNGETLKWLGQVGLNPLTVKSHISLQNVKCSTLTSFAHDILRLAPPTGTLSTETDCSIEPGKTTSRMVFSNLSLLLNGISLASPDESTPFLELPDTRMSGARIDLTGREIDLGTIAVKGGNVRLALNDTGLLNLQRIIAPPKKSLKEAKKATGDKQGNKAWTFHSGGFSIAGFAVHYEDRQRAPGLAAAIGELTGRFTAEAKTGEHPSVLMKNVMLQLSDILAGFTDTEPVVRIGSLTLKKGTADLTKKRVNAARIDIEGGAIQVERAADGTLNLPRLFSLPQKDDIRKKLDRTDTEPPDAIAAKQDGAAANRNDVTDKNGLTEGKTSTFQFLVDRISLSGMQTTFWDHMVQGDHPILHVDALSAIASQVDGHSPMPIELAGSIREGGRIKIAGMLNPTARSLTAKVEIASLALPTFQPYTAPLANVVLESGSVSSTGTFSYGIKETEAQTVYEGGIKVENLRIIETAIDEMVLGWKSLQSEQLKLLLQPDAVEIGDLQVQNLGGKAIIEKDGGFNLANLINTGAPGRSDSGTGAEPKKETGENKAFPYHIHRVLINDGRIKFGDHRLPIPFTTNIHELRGTLTNISSVKDTRSRLWLRAHVDEFGTVRAKGKVDTSNPKIFSDIKLAFRNIEISSLTPYSGKFAGRAIDAGKLSVDLVYEVNDAQLTGDNKIVVEQLKLGKRIKSPDAVDLPLDLVVALLKDDKGVMDVGLPIRGDLNNPQFSFGGLIGKALVNLLENIATSPFRAIGALIPGGDEKTLDSVVFAPGRAIVSPPEREKLLKLLEAIKKRPQLKLIVQGRYNPKKDRRALARHNLRDAVTARLGQFPASDERRSPLDFSSVKTREILEEMFVQQFGDDALKTFEDEMKNKPGEAKADDTDFLARNLFTHLLEGEPVPDDRLVELARARAEAVITEMGGAQGALAERFDIREPAVLEASEPITVTLSLEARQ